MNPLRKLMLSYQDEGLKVSLVPDYEDQKTYKVDLRHVTEWNEIEQRLHEIWAALEQTDAPKPKGTISFKDALNFVNSKEMLKEGGNQWMQKQSGGSSGPQAQEKQLTRVVKSRQQQRHMALKI